MTRDWWNSRLARVICAPKRCCRSRVSCRSATCANGCRRSSPPANGSTRACASGAAPQAIPGSSPRGRDSAGWASLPSDAPRVCAASTERSSGRTAAVRWTSRRANALFVWPAQLAQPIGVESFRTTLYWKRTPEEVLIATPSLALKTHDASLHGPAAWHQPADGGSPSMTLAVAVDNGNVAAAHLYLSARVAAPHGAGLAEPRPRGGTLVARRCRPPGAAQAFSVPGRHGPVPGSRAHRRHDARLPRGLAPGRRSGRRRGVSQRGAQRPVRSRQYRQPDPGPGRCAFCRFQGRGTRGARRRRAGTRAPRSLTCGRPRSTPWPSTPSPRPRPRARCRPTWNCSCRSGNSSSGGSSCMSTCTACR